MRLTGRDVALGGLSPADRNSPERNRLLAPRRRQIVVIAPRPARLGLKPGPPQAEAIGHGMKLLQRVSLHVAAALPAAPVVPLTERVVDVHRHQPVRKLLAA